MDDDDPNYNWNDKGDITDFFTMDFTMAELQTLRRKQVLNAWITYGFPSTKQRTGVKHDRVVRNPTWITTDWSELFSE